MYENGKQMNRYANKMIHKQKIKNKYRRDWFRRPCASWEDFSAHRYEWDDLRYWRISYDTGSRRFASDCSNSKLRAEFKEELAHMEYEEMYAPQKGNYKKHFDYWWTIW